MVGYKQTLCALLLTILLPGVAIAQNNTNSPYTRYGYVSWLISHLQTVKQWEGSLTDCAMDHISIR